MPILPQWNFRTSKQCTGKSIVGVQSMPRRSVYLNQFNIKHLAKKPHFIWLLLYVEFLVFSTVNNDYNFLCLNCLNHQSYQFESQEPHYLQL